ncbi:SPOR domain-containing protein [Reinekea marina]|uniref:SPOR domain-containing protein n=1 Tax=Reinekea marina TaxID=1310421 RepID=A0ABV7WM45_9GAMM|nr:SPOR domain-containing protein [Reinekea marina]MDN3648364.1 SPOR domain-containing protein [Reinekea marina]
MDLSEQSERMQSFYGLKYDPFGALVDAMVFSGAGGRYEIAETIRHLLTYSPQDGLVIGPAGSGKRMLIQHVVKMLEDHWRIAWIDGSEIETHDEFLREIVGQLGLGLKVESDVELMTQQINQIVASRTEAGEAFLLVVQFADHLPEPILALAHQFRPSASLDHRLHQLWLIESEAAAAELHEDDWFNYPLLPLTDEDATLYLKDRLVAAGNVGDLPFAAKDISRLNQMSQGSLLSLNELARDYLIGSTFRTAEKTKGFPLTHVIAGVAALTIVTIALLYNLNENKDQVDTVEVPVSSAPLSNVQQKLADAAAKIDAKSQQTSPTQAPSTTDAEKAPGESEPEPSLNETSPQSDSTAPATEEVPDQPVQAQASEVAVVAESSVPMSKPTLLDRAEDAQFTMQLVGVRDRSKLDSVTKEFSAPEKVDIVETTYQGKPWFVLIYGQFNSKAEAEKALTELPKRFEGESPWIRSFRDVRETAVN